jgi:exodeoxyribonuclease-3
MFKAASFNTNSIRARLPLILDWLDREKADVLCLQETKVEDKDFPLAEFNKKGYNTAFCGRKSYNGVAIISPHPLENVQIGIGDWAEPGEARLIGATVRGIPVVNTYVPQGLNPKSDIFLYKLKWIRAMSTLTAASSRKISWSGWVILMWRLSRLMCTTPKNYTATSVTTRKNIKRCSM